MHRHFYKFVTCTEYHSYWTGWYSDKTTERPAYPYDAGFNSDVHSWFQANRTTQLHTQTTVKILPSASEPMATKWTTVVKESWQKSHIIIAHGQFSRIFVRCRQCAPPHASLVPSESIPQMASRSVQPFLRSSWQKVHILYNGSSLSPSILPLCTGDLDPHLIHDFLGPPESITQTVSRSV